VLPKAVCLYLHDIPTSINESVEKLYCNRSYFECSTYLVYSATFETDSESVKISW